MSGKYQDIIHLPHHVSPTRPRMSAHDRAAQFSPFAALTGYEDLLHESARLTEERPELDELQQEAIRQALNRFQAELEDGAFPEVLLHLFRPDERKAGGRYEDVYGRLKKINAIEQLLVLTDGTVLPFSDVLGIESAE